MTGGKMSANPLCLSLFHSMVFSQLSVVASQPELLEHAKSATYNLRKRHRLTKGRGVLTSSDLLLVKEHTALPASV